MADVSSIGGSYSAYANRPTRIDNFFSRNDKDGDGKLSLDEFKAIGQNSHSGTATNAGSSATSPADLFKQIDADNDGSITKDEMKAYRDQQVAQTRTAMLNLQEMFGDQAGPKGSHGHKHHHHMEATSPTTSTQDGSPAGTSGTADIASELMKMLDTSADGSISKDELSAFLQKMTAQAA